MGTYHYIKGELSNWRQKVWVLWKKLNLLDKILFYLFFSAFFVIVIPSLLNDFFYTSIYLTDFSVGFSILLVFFCVFWLGYFSSHGERGEFKKNTFSKKRHTALYGVKAKKDMKKEKKEKRVFLIILNKFLTLKKFSKFSMILDVFYKKSVFYFSALTKKLSPGLVLSLGIYYHSKKNIKTQKKIQKNDTEPSMKIKDLPFLLPILSNNKKKPCSYHLMMKNLEEAKKVLSQKALKTAIVEREAITDRTRKWH